MEVRIPPPQPGGADVIVQELEKGAVEASSHFSAFLSCKGTEPVQLNCFEKQLSYGLCPGHVAEVPGDGRPEWLCNEKTPALEHRKTCKPEALLRSSTRLSLDPEFFFLFSDVLVFWEVFCMFCAGSGYLHLLP